jgi:hypothetical protein
MRHATYLIPAMMVVVGLSSVGCGSASSTGAPATNGSASAPRTGTDTPTSTVTPPLPPPLSRAQVAHVVKRSLRSDSAQVRRSVTGLSFLGEGVLVVHVGQVSVTSSSNGNTGGVPQMLLNRAYVGALLCPVFTQLLKSLAGSSRIRTVQFQSVGHRLIARVSHGTQCQTAIIF